MYTSKLASVFSALIGLSLCQSTFPEDNHTFKLIRADNDLSMDLEGGNRDEGAVVSQYGQYADDWGMYNQQWHLISGSRTNPTAFRIRNVRSNTYLTVGDGNTDNNAFVGTWAVTGTANQTWFFQPEGDNGLYRIVNQASGTCLTFGDETDNNGVRMVGYDCATSPAGQRQFALRRTSNTAAELLPILQAPPINAVHVARFVRGRKTIFAPTPLGMPGRQWEFSAVNQRDGLPLDAHFNGAAAAAGMEVQMAFSSSREMADVTTDLKWGTLLGYNSTNYYAFNFYISDDYIIHVFDPINNVDDFDLTGWTIRDAYF